MALKKIDYKPKHNLADENALIRLSIINYELKKIKTKLFTLGPLTVVSTLCGAFFAQTGWVTPSTPFIVEMSMWLSFIFLFGFPFFGSVMLYSILKKEKTNLERR